jgi:hypothetical protein
LQLDVKSNPLKFEHFIELERDIVDGIYRTGLVKITIVIHFRQNHPELATYTSLIGIP